MSFSFKNCESLLACLDENPKLVLKKIVCLTALSIFIFPENRFTGGFLMGELEELQRASKQNVK